MITNENTKRAIEAIKRQDRDIFHDNLDDYLIEVLESLTEAPTETDMILLSKDVDFRLCALSGYQGSETRIEVQEVIKTWLNG